jgi:hypothetical protein
MTGGGGADVFVFRPGQGAINMASIARIGSINGFTVGLDGGGTATVTYSFPVNPTGVGTLSSGAAGTLTVGGVQLNTVVQSGTAILPLNAIGNSPLTGQTVAYGEATVNYAVGTLTAVTLGSSAPTGATTFATADYGYSTAGVDVITDFQTGIDQIRISSSLTYGANAVTAAAPGSFTAVAGIGTSLSTLTNNFIYDTSTGILYFNPSDTGTAEVVNTIPGVVTGGTFNIGTDATQLGTVGFTAGPASVFSGGTAFTLNYTFGTIADQKSIGVNAEVPFLQVLNNRAPVGNLTYSTDITIF